MERGLHIEMVFKCRKSSLGQNTEEVFFLLPCLYLRLQQAIASVLYPVPPLKVGRLGFSKHCHCWRLQLGSGGGGVLFSVITSLIDLLFFSSVSWKYTRGKGGFPVGIAGPLELAMRQQRQPTPQTYSILFPCNPAVPGGEELVYLATENKTPKASDQVRSVLLHILHTVTR